MTTLLYTHPSYLAHDTGPGHPENANRLLSIGEALDTPEFSGLLRKTAPSGTHDQIGLIHPQPYIDRIFRAIPKQGNVYIDGDTVASPGSGEAALHAIGAAVDAIDQVFTGQADNAFCALRPPGHHAETERPMGFCLFNNIAVAAEYARSKHQVERVAIVDFDVHHGNGTQEIFYTRPTVLYASTHQSPLYPGTGSSNETGAGNIFNVPLPAGSGTKAFQSAMTENIFPALHKFKPELLLISAGFDAHKDDPLASLEFVESDYAWITRQLIDIAGKYCRGRIVSMLEGGYNLKALGRSVAVHVQELMAA